MILIIILSLTLNKPKDCKDRLPGDVSLSRTKSKMCITKRFSDTYHINMYFTGTGWSLNQGTALYNADSCLLKRLFFASKIK